MDSKNEATTCYVFPMAIYRPKITKVHQLSPNQAELKTPSIEQPNRDNGSV